MTLAVWNGTAADESSGNLNVLVSPTVTVTDKATGAQPSLFSDRAGNTGIGNPFTAGADGSIEFYVKPGRYKIVADDGSGNTATWDDELIGTLHGIDQPQESDLAYYDNANDRWTRLAVAASTIIGRLASGAVKALTTEETRRLLDDPEHATDSGTDTYVSATNTTPPADGVKITRDFQSPNTTTTPTLDGKTITDVRGNVLWSSAIQGPHTLKYVSSSDEYLLLDMRATSANLNNSLVGRDGSGRAKFADPSTAQHAATKGWAESTLARIATGTYTGDGTRTQSITGIGFQPSFLKIWRQETSESTAISIHETTSEINDDFGNASVAVRTLGGSSSGPDVLDNTVKSLDSDGFTVDDGGADSDPNANNQVYNYMAIG